MKKKFGSGQASFGKLRTSYLSCTIFVLLFVLVCSFAWAAGQDELRYITVTGDAEIRVVPDEVVISTGVETLDKNLTAAKNENDKVVREVLSLAKKYGIEPKHMQTSQINIEPKYRYYENKKIFEGYQVSKTVIITLKDISKFENLFSSMLESGVNYVHNISFRTSEPRKYRDKARIMAIKAAYEKAKALASELGQTIGKPYVITENSSGSSFAAYRQNVQNAMASDGAGSTEGVIAPGEITVNASVTVKFELQ